MAHTVDAAGGIDVSTRRLRRWAGSLALFVTVLLAVAACGSSGTAASSSSGPVRGGNLTMARAGEPTSLIPWVPQDNLAIWSLEEIYDTLLVPAPNGHGVLPSLASSYKESADKLSWTFNLRPGLEFSNGKPLTSADVKWSIDQSRNPDTVFSSLDAIITSVDDPTPTTVVVHTSAPWAPLPADMALYANSIVPQNFGGETQAQFENHPIGSGPFEFSKWVHGQYLKLVRNPRYWQKGKPYLNSVTFTDVADSNTRATQLQSGQVQINEFPDDSSIKELQASSTVKVGLFESSRVDYLEMNNQKAPFNDPNVRLAIAQATDRKALIKTALFGHGTLPTSYLTPALWAHDGAVKPPAYNLQQAKQDLAKSSVPHGFSTTMLLSAGDATGLAEAQLVQSSLAKIGIKITFQTLDPNTAFQQTLAGNYDMTFGYCTTDIVDPDEIIRFAGVYAGGGYTLDTFYNNPQLLTWANDASKISDQATRQTYYNEIQEAINKANPYVVLYYSPSVYSYSDKVHDFHPFPTGNYNLVDTWLSS